MYGFDIIIFVLFNVKDCLRKGKVKFRYLKKKFLFNLCNIVWK